MKNKENFRDVLINSKNINKISYYPVTIIFSTLQDKEKDYRKKKRTISINYYNTKKTIGISYYKPISKSFLLNE